MWDGSHVVDLGIVMAVTNLEIEQLNFTFLERYLSAKSHWLKCSTAGYIWSCKNLHKWWKQSNFLLVNDEIFHILTRLSAREHFIDENQAWCRQMMTVTKLTFKMMITTKCTIGRWGEWWNLRPILTNDENNQTAHLTYDSGNKIAY